MRSMDFELRPLGGPIGRELVVHCSDSALFSSKRELQDTGFHTADATQQVGDEV
jgi:tRNA pseudouridine-54 N-methylase